MVKPKQINTDVLYSAIITDTGYEGDTMFIGVYSSKEKAKDALDNFHRIINDIHHTQNYLYGYHDEIKEIRIDSDPGLDRLLKKRRY